MPCCSSGGLLPAAPESQFSARLSCRSCDAGTTKTVPQFSSMQLVTKTKLPDTIGDACPMPGILTFQAMLSVVLLFVGTCFSRLVPSPRGPRYNGQSSANPGTTTRAMPSEASRRGDITRKQDLVLMPDFTSLARKCAATRRMPELSPSTMHVLTGKDAHRKC